MLLKLSQIWLKFCTKDYKLVEKFAWNPGNIINKNVTLKHYKHGYEKILKI